MTVVPLTLTISLALVFTFVVFFLREHSRRRYGGAESDSLMPLARETPRVVGTPSIPAVAATVGCGCAEGRHAPCAGCLKSPPAAPDSTLRPPASSSTHV